MRQVLNNQLVRMAKYHSLFLVVLIPIQLVGLGKWLVGRHMEGALGLTPYNGWWKVNQH